MSSVKAGSVTTRVNGKELGIDEELISTIVETFYLRIRADKELGPIFNDVVEDWNPHLAKMKDFWSSIILYTRKYSGKPMPMHKRLKGVEPRHFARWLDIFRNTLEDVTTSNQIVGCFMQRAEQIARTLQAGMFRSMDSQA